MMQRAANCPRVGNSPSASPAEVWKWINLHIKCIQHKHSGIINSFINISQLTLWTRLKTQFINLKCNPLAKQTQTQFRSHRIITTTSLCSITQYPDYEFEHFGRPFNGFFVWQISTDSLWTNIELTHEPIRAFIFCPVWFPCKGFWRTQINASIHSHVAEWMWQFE